jgi:chromate reductase
MTNYRVGYIVGSLSKDSINRLLARALIRRAPESLLFVEIPIGDLPLYNRDYDDDYPPAGRALKEAIESVDAVLFVTPEYNRGVPGALKNAIDWASRPWERTRCPVSRPGSSARRPERSEPPSVNRVCAARWGFATRPR